MSLCTIRPLRCQDKQGYDCLSPKTVETYRSRLMRKLGISDLPGLVKFAIQHGLTPLE